MSKVSASPCTFLRFWLLDNFCLSIFRRSLRTGRRHGTNWTIETVATGTTSFQWAAVDGPGEYGKQHVHTRLVCNTPTQRRELSSFVEPVSAPDSGKKKWKWKRLLSVFLFSFIFFFCFPFSFRLWTECRSRRRVTFAFLVRDVQLRDERIGEHPTDLDLVVLLICKHAAALLPFFCLVFIAIIFDDQR